MVATDVVGPVSAVVHVVGGESSGGLSRPLPSGLEEMGLHVCTACPRFPFVETKSRRDHDERFRDGPTSFGSRDYLTEERMCHGGRSPAHKVVAATGVGVGPTE